MHMQELLVDVYGGNVKKRGSKVNKVQMQVGGLRPKFPRINVQGDFENIAGGCPSFG